MNPFEASPRPLDLRTCKWLTIGAVWALAMIALDLVVRFAS